jgi:hypothetical protein
VEWQDGSGMAGWEWNGRMGVERIGADWIGENRNGVEGIGRIGPDWNGLD